MDSRDPQFRAPLCRRQGVTGLVVVYLALIGGLLGSASAIL